MGPVTFGVLCFLGGVGCGVCACMTLISHRRELRAKRVVFEIGPPRTGDEKRPGRGFPNPTAANAARSTINV